MADKTYTIEEIGELANALGIAQKHTPSSTTLTAPALHGAFQGNAAQFGIFSRAGVRPEMFTTLVRPQSLGSILSLNQSMYRQELLEVMTGVTASSGTNATGWCGDPPTVGQGKVCQQVYGWGEYYVKTDLNALPRLGELRNRADVPRDLLNAAPEQRNPLVPEVMYRLDDTQSQLRYELWRIGVSLERSLETVLIQGNTALGSANTNHGWISEFSGLDNQITTGYTDSPTGFTCPAMDSAVITFNADVGGTIGGGDGRNIVQAMTDMFWALQDRAMEMGLSGTQWVILCRKELFRPLVETWSCQYATYRCTSTNAPNTTLNEDMPTVNALRLEMMQGQYLLIDGQQIPVVLSEGITRQGVGANNFQTDLYFVPISWQGMPLTRLEFYPMDNQYTQEFASFASAVGGEVATLNNGLFIVGNRSTGLCLEWHFGSRMRLILETPFLAGRVDNIQAVFRAPIRNSDPTDTYFYADGGRTYVT